MDLNFSAEELPSGTKSVRFSKPNCHQRFPPR